MATPIAPNWSGMSSDNLRCWLIWSEWIGTVFTKHGNEGDFHTSTFYLSTLTSQDTCCWCECGVTSWPDGKTSARRPSATGEKTSLWPTLPKRGTDARWTTTDTELKGSLNVGRWYNVYMHDVLTCLASAWSTRDHERARTLAFIGAPHAHLRHTNDGTTNPFKYLPTCLKI